MIFFLIIDKLIQESCHAGYVIYKSNSNVKQKDIKGIRTVIGIYSRGQDR